jgi:hypothetical protein
MSTVPADRTTESSAAQHVSDHNLFAAAYNGPIVAAGVADLTLFSGTPVVNTLAALVPAWLLDPAATEDLTTSRTFPGDWATAHIDVVWAPTASAAGNVVLRVQALSFGDGEAIPGSFTTLGTATVANPGTQFVAEVTRVATGYTVPAGETVVFKIQRLGADGGDTFASDIGLIEVRFTKAS